MWLPRLLGNNLAEEWELAYRRSACANIKLSELETPTVQVRHITARYRRPPTPADVE